MVNLQTERRGNPYPFTWEIPAGIILGWLLFAALGVQVGRGLANLTGGRGWTWPASRNLFSSLPGVLGGNAGAGLTATGGWADPTTLTVWLLIVQLLLLTGLITVVVWGMRRWGPQRMKGMANQAEAETTLGVSRLRTVRRIIRPDLYPPSRTLTDNRGGHDGYHPER